MRYIIEMQEDDEIVGEVNKVNTEFYHAFESLSVEMMGRLWKHDENVVCIHTQAGIYSLAGWQYEKVG